MTATATASDCQRGQSGRATAQTRQPVHRSWRLCLVCPKPICICHVARASEADRDWEPLGAGQPTGPPRREPKRESGIEIEGSEGRGGPSKRGGPHHGSQISSRAWGRSNQIKPLSCEQVGPVRDVSSVRPPDRPTARPPDRGRSAFCVMMRGTGLQPAGGDRTGAGADRTGVN